MQDKELYQHILGLTQNAGTVPGYFYVSLSVLENRRDLGRTVRLGRTIQCSRRASVPRAALRCALGYLLLPLWGRRIGSRPEARGVRLEGTAKQPENFGAILRRYPRITMHVA